MVFAFYSYTETRMRKPLTLHRGVLSWNIFYGDQLGGKVMKVSFYSSDQCPHCGDGRLFSTPKIDVPSVLRGDKQKPFLTREELSKVVYTCENDSCTAEFRVEDYVREDFAVCDSRTVILFLGRSFEGIKADADSIFSGEVVVVARDDDQLEHPDGLTTVEVSQFQPQKGVLHTVIANGGTSLQLVPVLKKLVESEVEFQAYDLQRDGMVKLW